VVSRIALALALLVAVPALAEPPLAEQARDVLMPRCGECHDGKRDSAKPKALAVFDLSRATWFDSIRDDQLDKVIQRVSNKAPAEDTARVASFVAAERARRAER
jgi:hypothetical protein